MQNNLPGQRTPTKTDKVPETKARIDAACVRGSPALRPAGTAGLACAWEDEDEVLHDQSYFYLVIDPGRWQIEHSRRKGHGKLSPGGATPCVFTAVSADRGATGIANGTYRTHATIDRGDAPQILSSPPSARFPNGPGEVE